MEIKNRDALKKECLRLKTPLSRILKKANDRLNKLTTEPYYTVPIFIDLDCNIYLHLNSVNNTSKEFVYSYYRNK